ncbi:uncharacterized protein SAMN02746065_10737 [Desulfocicer vacuolatum DSM 3385]|uniref:Asparagine synthetase domain-containing protein n=1 Tax=Desulfocicer vacuolatum DSM 3385 TaxID=1121400 RepID=A0A1W2B7L9_9BACT|nr:ATP-dependent sacrificial sulfur transferase LarE [Desulfocicer vacuolatum]SMC68781.1 uncharacterized protein SAMN02746065_10737 [Desulfocicer vacuolatum DSM 3385]
MRKKIEELKTLLKIKTPLAIAFSGGVDSVFLAAMAKKNMGSKILLLTLVSEFQAKQDTDNAIRMAEKLGLPHEIIHFNPWEDQSLIQNNENRCYLCKKLGFSLLRMAAENRGFTALAHGVNQDDLSDYRPGLTATGELGILSPLVDAGLTKAEIRTVSREMGLETWNMPSQSCLATRIPYGEQLTRKKIQQISDAEAELQQLGFEKIRVRCHGDMARIECDSKDIETLSSSLYRKKITKAFYALGFKFVSLDLDGYASGNMNRGLRKA